MPKEKDNETETVHIKDISGKDMRKKIKAGLERIKQSDKTLKIKVWKSHFEAMGARKDVLLMAEEHPKIILDIVGLDRGPKGYQKIKEELIERGFSDEERSSIISTLYEVAAFESAGVYIESIDKHEKFGIVGSQKYQRNPYGIPKDDAIERYSVNTIEILEQLDLIQQKSTNFSSNCNFRGIGTTKHGTLVAKEYFNEELWNGNGKSELMDRISSLSPPLLYCALHNETTPKIEGGNRLTLDIVDRWPRTYDSFSNEHTDSDSLVFSVYRGEIDTNRNYKEFWNYLEDLGIAVKGFKIKRSEERQVNTKIIDMDQNVQENIIIRYIPKFAAEEILSTIEHLLPNDGVIPRLLMYLNRKPAKEWKTFPDRGLPQYGLGRKNNLSHLKKLIEHLHQEGIASAWVDSEIPYTINNSKFLEYVKRYFERDLDINLE